MNVPRRKAAVELTTSILLLFLAGLPGPGARLAVLSIATGINKLARAAKCAALQTAYASATLHFGFLCSHWSSGTVEFMHLLTLELGFLCSLM